MYTFSGEKPHKCNICEKSFRRSDALHCHQKTHKKEIGKKEAVETAEVAITDCNGTAMVQTYPIGEMNYDDNVVQYNENDKQMQLQDHHNQLELMNEVGQGDMANIESITVLRPHQTDTGEQTFNTFSYNFIL